MKVLYLVLVIGMTTLCACGKNEGHVDAADSGASGDGGSDTGADADTDTNVDMDTDTNSNVDTDTNSNVDTDTNSDVDTEVNTDPGIGTDSETGAELDAGSDSGSDAVDGGVDATLPIVQSVSPLDAASGITADTNIIITFSEPMDTASVALAYQSTDLPAANAAFIWSVSDTVLTIDPNAPLPYATGTDPSATSARVIAYSLSTVATDKAGNSLAASFSASFSTLRHITQTIDPALSLRGHVRGDGDVTGVIFVGDTNFDLTNRGFVSYPLADVPDGINSFQSATVTLTESEVNGSPYSNLGTLWLRGVAYSALDLTAFNASYTGELAIPASGSEKNLDVLSFVEEDLTNNETYTQYRFEFSTQTDSDGAFDSVTFTNSTPLVLEYLIP